VCRYVFGEFGLVAGLVRRSQLSSGRVWPGRLNVGTCSAMSRVCRYLLGEVG